VADATRMNLLDISIYLNSVMSESIIKQYCSKFSNGILSKGILSAIGTFRNRFEEMQIKISTSKDTSELQTLLAGTRFGSKTGRFANITILRTYYQCQELYISRVLELMISNIITSYEEHTA
jgi:hypothetical protein